MPHVERSAYVHYSAEQMFELVADARVIADHKGGVRPLRSGACRVLLSLNYQLAGSLLARAVAPVFSTIVNSQVKSFAARAEQLYGPP